jgi:myo-inositol-1(or 4)-monophosphatase
VARQAGEFIRTEAQGFSLNKVETKGVHNFVSYVDKCAEQLIVKQLRDLLPEAGFITEEGTETARGERFNWVIDPLDGTTNFIHGLPPYSVSIGLVDGSQPVVGVVYVVTADECFYAWQGGGAWLNGKPVHTSDCASVEESLIATGFPYTDYHLMTPYIDCLKHLLHHSHGVRRFGSAAVDLAYVACGRFEGFYEYGLSPWDVAGGLCILHEAGGRSSDFSGGDNVVFGKELVASAPRVFDEFLGVVRQFLHP